MVEGSSLLKNGNKVLIDSQPYLVIDNEFVNPGKGQAFTRIKIKNLLNNKVLEKTVKIGESLEEADVLNTKMQFLYKESESLYFMNLETYEQTYVKEEIIKDKSCWLKDGDECDVTIWNNSIIQIELPKFVTFTVASTVDAIKGDTVSSTLKEATLDNGSIIMVPIFIKEGEKIKIDTETNEYSSRVKE